MARVLAGTVYDMPDGAQKVVELEDEEVLVVHASGKFYAISDICSHQELDLEGGEVHGHRIKCPHHGSWFDLETGQALNLPAVRPVRAYRTIVEDDKVYVETVD